MQIHAHSNCEEAAGSETDTQNSFGDLSPLLCPDFVVSFPAIYSVTFPSVCICLNLISLFVCIFFLLVAEL